MNNNKIKLTQLSPYKEQGSDVEHEPNLANYKHGESLSKRPCLMKHLSG